MLKHKCPKCTKRLERKTKDNSACIPLMVDMLTTSNEYRMKKCTFCKHKEYYKVN